MDTHELQRLFEQQFPDLSVGGFYNPRLIAECTTIMEFRCHYNGFDNEEDSWTWYWNKEGYFFN